ncbi:Cyclin-dependent kinase inhibitor [Dirofilaria immitis]|nr:BMA-CKI-1 [Dirofilaria immitis]
MEDSVIISTPVNATTTATVPHKMGPVKLLKRSARRCLFGRPDPQNVDQWLTKELNEIRREQQLRWGFLFGPENPCPSTITTEWEFIPVPAESVPQFYRSSYYLSSRCTPCETENCTPCSTNINNNYNMDSMTTITSAYSGPEPVIPATSSLSKCKERRIAKKQTKLTAFMNVDSRKRLRQQTKKVPSSPKSIRLMGRCRSFI